MLATFSADLGRSIQIKFPDEAGIRSMEVEWSNKKVPFAKVGDQWITVLGVDLDAKPGDHPANVKVTMQDGRTDLKPMLITVNDVKYPTTELKVEEKYVQLSPQNLKRANRETKELEAIHSTITPEILWKDDFIVPIEGGAGRNFGHRRVFNGEPRAPHAGADLRASTGIPIHSTNRGRIVLAKNLFFTGNTVIVDHGIGIYSLYAHLSRIDVKKGDLVERDKVVGLAGATGRVTGPHLHWGMRVQGARVDPFSLVEMR